MKKILICIIICLFGVLIFKAEAKKTITAAADSYLPFVDPDNINGGLSIEIIRAALKTQGYNLKYINIPWARAVVGVNSGTYDILPDAWKSKEREKVQIFSDYYTVSRLKFVKRKGDPFEYNGLKSLTDLKIGTIRGYSYTNDFDNASNFTKESVPNIMQNIQKLLSGRIDLTLDDETVITAYLKKNNPDLLKEIEFTRNSLSSNPLYVSCGRKNPNCKDIINAFNRGLKIIKSDGTYNKIFNRYIQDNKK